MSIILDAFMNHETIMSELRETLRYHGYSFASVRSYSYYVKDFLMWLKTKPPAGKPNLPKNYVTAYGLHLKEERSLGDSAVSQGIRSVSFLVQHILKNEDVERDDIHQPP